MYVMRQKNLPPWQAIDEVFSVFTSFLFHCSVMEPCNTAMNKCNQSNWLPEIFFNALLWTRYICRANKYKISVPVGSVWWEWVICLAYERCIHFHSSLFISRPLSAYGFRDGIHHLSAHEQMCWRRPDWSVRMSRAAAPVLEGSPYKLCYLLRLLSTSSFLYCGTRSKAAFFYFLPLFKNTATLG